MALAHRRPYGIYRWLANAPRWFYRLGLGRVLGHRVVQITHRGRKSGLLHRTVLEVLQYDQQTREVFVVSGWEGKTDWYRNIEREPALEVRIGWMHYRPVQEFLSPEETAQLILTLFRQRPREVRFVGPLPGIDPDAEDAALRARLETFFRGVRFRPADDGLASPVEQHGHSTNQQAQDDRAKSQRAMVANSAWETHQLEASHDQQDCADELPAPRILTHCQGSVSW